MSTEEQSVPKRRSSAANRRRRKRGSSAASAPVQQQAVEQSTVASTEAPAESVNRHLQRRDERKAAKARSEKKGIARVTEGERLSGARKFYNETMSEIRKVNWPDRNQTINLTLLVIALSVIMGSLLGGIDWVLLQVFEAIG